MNPESQVLAFLLEHSISFERLDHPPLFTCDDAQAYGLPPLPGADTKNLFLENEKKELILVVTTCRKKVALNDLRRSLGFKKLSFAGAEKLLECLGVTPGAVTSLGLILDTGKQVALYIDTPVWSASHVQCHPCTNEVTLTIPQSDYRKFLKVLEREPKIIDVPERVS